MFTRRAFFAASSAFAAAPALAITSRNGKHVFGADVVRRDLDAIWSALLEVGTEPFLTSARSTVEDRYRTALAGITSAMTVREAWLAIAPVLGALNDGHVGLGFPDPLNTAPRRFPLRFALSDNDDALLVASDHSNTIPLSSRIVSIDDIPAERYRGVTLAAYGAQTRALHRARVTGSGAWTAVALFGIGPTYKVRWITPAGMRHEADVPTAAPQATAGSHVEDPYTYRRIQHGTVGFIDYRSCDDLPRFKRFLTETFGAIKANPIRALVIDIRSNGGGMATLTMCSGRTSARNRLSNTAAAS